MHLLAQLAAAVVLLASAAQAPPAAPVPAPPAPVSPPARHASPDRPGSRGVHVGFDEDDLPGGGSKLVYKPIQAPPFGDHIDIRPMWLFHSGPADGQDFTSPTLDDSKWIPIETARPLFTYMIFGVNEIWYRTHVHLAPGSQDLALSLAGIGGSYRLSVNGRELGGHGLMSGPGEYLVAPSDTFLIPNDLLTPTPASSSAASSSPPHPSASPSAASPSRPAPSPAGAQTSPDLLITLHVFSGTVTRITFGLETGISLKSIIFLGPSSTLLRDQRYFAQTSSAETGAILTVWAIVLILASALAVLVPAVRVYPVLAVYAAAHLLARILANVADSNYLSHTHWITWPQNLALAVTVVAALELCRLIAGSPRRLWLNLLQGVYTLSIFTIYPATWGLVSYYFYSTAYQAARIALVPAFLFFVIAGAWRRRVDAIILLATGVAYGLYSLVWLLLSSRSLANILLDTYVRGFTQRVTPASMAELAFILGFLVVLIVHTLRIIRERSHIASEMQAARTMQQLLLARSSDPTPGFIVETAYLPAGDVGGDFFLAGLARPEPPPDAGGPGLMPPAAASGQHPGSQDSGSQDLFAIVGDVSGKGLNAAMRVSMILGVLRREPSRSPATVLCSLNEALLSQADTGFTTACCVRLSPSGHFTVANAGHLAPYLVGPRLGVLRAQEMITPPTLPLGLAPDQVYETIQGRLAPGERLVLLSDGVPEARSPKGELYGFDRTLPLVLRPAGEIATTALAFGQEDDITVLTLACNAPTTNQPPPPPLASAPPPPPPPPPPPASTR